MNCLSPPKALMSPFIVRHEEGVLPCVALGVVVGAVACVEGLNGVRNVPSVPTARIKVSRFVEVFRKRTAALVKWS